MGYYFKDEVGSEISNGISLFVDEWRDNSDDVNKTIDIYYKNDDIRINIGTIGVINKCWDYMDEGDFIYNQQFIVLLARIDRHRHMKVSKVFDIQNREFILDVDKINDVYKKVKNINHRKK